LDEASSLLEAGSFSSFGLDFSFSAGLSAELASAEEFTGSVLLLPALQAVKQVNARLARHAITIIFFFISIPHF
jgi:hypothetical protein